MLDAVADALDAAAGTLVPLAVAESHLAEGRLTGELRPHDLPAAAVR